MLFRSESYFLKRNCEIKKKGTTMTIYSPDKNIVLQAHSDGTELFHLRAAPVLSQSRDCVNFSKSADAPAQPPRIAKVSLSFAKIAKTSKTVTKPSDATRKTLFKQVSLENCVNQTLQTALVAKQEARSAANTHTHLSDDACYYAFVDLQAEAEARRLLPYQADIDAAYATRPEAAYEDLQLWHEILGHRNYKDVATMLGIALPTKLPQCITCLRAKSKRHALGKRAWPLHDAPRPGYA